jgi:membrane protein DedA with SNARE-associated domain
MSDKPIAGLLTAIAVAPLCLVCALGPAALAAAAGSFLAWLGGFSLPLIAAAVAAAGWVGWRALQQWQTRRVQAVAENELQR